jgi:glycosyltransferase involved in cell wall biosynthesis
MSDNSHITLTVIITCYNARNTIRRCLDSLRQQQTDRPFEIIVVDSSDDDTADIVAKGYPEVRLLRFAERKYCGSARNAAIAEARSDIMVFIDADCEARHDWVASLLRAHQAPHMAIGGSIANGDQKGRVGWAAYFCEFSQWMPETPAGLMDDIAGANLSYKRQAFDEFGSFIEGTYCSDTEFNWRLGRARHWIRFDPSIAINHYCIDRLGALLGHEFIHGRCFGRVRVKAQRFSLKRRALYAALWPLIPVVLLSRVARRNLTNRVYLRQFLGSSPLILLGLTSWSFGECVGYINPTE